MKTLMTITRSQLTLSKAIGSVAFVLVLCLLVVLIGVARGELIWIVMFGPSAILLAIALPIMIWINYRRNTPKW